MFAIYSDSGRHCDFSIASGWVLRGAVGDSPRRCSVFLLSLTFLMMVTPYLDTVSFPLFMTGSRPCPLIY